MDFDCLQKLKKKEEKKKAPKKKTLTDKISFFGEQNLIVRVSLCCSVDICHSLIVALTMACVSVKDRLYITEHLTRQR